MLHIKKALLAISFLFCFSTVFAIDDTLHYVKSPYRTEYTPYFELGQFKRGFSNDSLKRALDTLESKSRAIWKREDSLTFAEISLRTGNKALSRYYFEALKVRFDSEEKYWYDALMIPFLNKQYDIAQKKIRKESPMVLQFSKIYFFEKIIQAESRQKADEKWFKKGVVLNWKVDTTLNNLDKGSQLFRDKIIIPLTNLQSILKIIIAHVHEEDPVIASTCREMGHIIEAHLSLTQAYIAYSLGRHYNKWDKDLLADLKAVKAKMTEKKYKIPNFRKYFPRIEYWRFDYQVLKEKVIFEKNDTTKYIEPSTMRPRPKANLSFPYQYIIIGGVALFFIVILIFIRTKK